MAEEQQNKLKVYCETSFWSWLVSRPSTNPDHAVKQAWTRKWWEEVAPKCDVYVSEYLLREVARGDADFAKLRLEAIKGSCEVDGSLPAIIELAKALISKHAVPAEEVTDAYHIAAAAVHDMDVLLTWNCKHMANRFVLPKTISVIAQAGYKAPAIVTPENYYREELND